MTCPEGYSCHYIIDAAWTAEQMFAMTVIATAGIVIALTFLAIVMWRSLR